MRRVLTAIVTFLSVLVAITAFGPTPAAFAYNLSGCRFHASGNHLRWQDSTTRSAYSRAARLAVAAWNNGTAHVRMTEVSTRADIRVTDGAFGLEWMGLKVAGITMGTNRDPDIRTSCSGGYWTTTMVTWFNRSYGDSMDAAKRKTIIMHEIGHALGLAHSADRGSCVTPSVMAANIFMLYDTCPDEFTVPGADDLAGLDAIY